MDSESQQHKRHRERRAGKSKEKKKVASLKKKGIDPASAKGVNLRAFKAQGTTKAKSHGIQSRFDRQAVRTTVAIPDRGFANEEPPLVIAVVGPPGSGKTTVVASLVKRYSRQRLSKISGPVTCVAGKNRRFTFVDVPSRNLPAAIDASKIADIVLLTINAAVGFELDTFEFLTIARTHALPCIIGVLSHIDKLSTTAARVCRKTTKNRFAAEVAGSRLFILQGLQSDGLYTLRDIHNLHLFLSVATPTRRVWRQTHSYLVCDRADAVHDNDDGVDDNAPAVALFGYVRGMPLRCGTSIHIPGAGDFLVEEIETLPDPCPLPHRMKGLRSLKDRERRMYAPHSDHSGIIHDGAGVSVMVPVDAASAAVASGTAVDHHGGVGLLSALKDIATTTESVVLRKPRLALFGDARPGTPEVPSDSDSDHSTADETQQFEEEIGTDSECSGNSLLRPVRRRDTCHQADSESLPIRVFWRDGVIHQNAADIPPRRWDDQHRPDWTQCQCERIRSFFVTGYKDIIEAEPDWSSGQEEAEESQSSDADACSGDAVSESQVASYVDSDLLKIALHEYQQSAVAVASAHDVRLHAMDADVDPHPTLGDDYRRKKLQKRAEFDADVSAETPGGKNKGQRSTAIEDLHSDIPVPSSLNGMDNLAMEVKSDVMGAVVGNYVRVIVRSRIRFPSGEEVPTSEKLAACLMRAPVLIAGGIPPGEGRLGILFCRIKRHRWFPKLINSGDPLILSAGWRRFQSIMMFAMEDPNSRHRFVKYTPPHIHCIGAFTGPSLPANTGITGFVGGLCEEDADNFRVAACGYVMESSAASCIVKKLKLTGYPLSIKQTTCFVRGMFNSPLEVTRFIGSRIRTVSGLRGIIKKPAGKAFFDSMRSKSSREKRDAARDKGVFRATFEDKLSMGDIIFMRTWVPVTPPALYNPINSYIGTWTPMRTKWQVKRDEGVFFEGKSRSAYLSTEEAAALHASVSFKEPMLPKSVEGKLPFAQRMKLAKLQSRNQEQMISSVPRRLRGVPDALAVQPEKAEIELSALQTGLALMATESAAARAAAKRRHRSAREVKQAAADSMKIAKQEVRAKKQAERTHEKTAKRKRK